MGDYVIRVLGTEDGFLKSESERAAELTEVKKLMMATEGHFLPDVFQNLMHHADDCRLLVLECLEGGQARIDGCVAYTYLHVVHTDPITGRNVLRRIVMLRILTVRKSDHRAELAKRLCLEAQLRGTIRGLYDNEDEPQILGTIGVIMAKNEPALKWAEHLGDRVRIIAPDLIAAICDPVLGSVHRYAETVRVRLGKGESYRFVVANRTSLIEAARLNSIGRLHAEPGNSELRVSYDTTDFFDHQIEVAVKNLRRRNPATLARLGLDGDPDATVWGPPETAAMRLDGVDDNWGRLESNGK